jgi:hypothetical protein
MSQITELGSAQITAVDSITIELVEADETPAVVIVRWPVKPSVIHPHRFADVVAIERTTPTAGGPSASPPGSSLETPGRWRATC